MNEEIRQKREKDFIDKSREIHKNYYGYKLVKFENNRIPVIITCPVHGEFKQTPQKHKIGQGCVYCSKGKLTKEDVISRASNVHDDEYIYLIDTYSGFHKKMEIECKRHGVFSQRVDYHLKGGRCPKCSYDITSERNKLTNKEFIDRSLTIHNSRYDYSKTGYEGIFQEVEIICPIHGSFFQTPDCHLKGYNCPRCSNAISQHEYRIGEFIESLGFEIVRGDRKVISPKELDIFIPSKQLAIEYCGLYWHSEKLKKDKNYHKQKYEDARQKGVTLVTIFEDEWIEKEEIIKSRIKNLLGASDTICGARKCDIKFVDKKTADDFLELYHLQGKTPVSHYHVGGYHDDALVAIMQFKRGIKEVELVRYATNGNVYPGLASKLFSAFVKNEGPDIIKTFADLRWSNGYLYETLGFTEDKKISPDYYYTKNFTERKRKEHFRLEKIQKKMNIEVRGRTERELMLSMGYYRVWDCGKVKYVWKRT